MKEIYRHAIHSKVLVVYVLNRADPELPQDAKGWRGDWAAYVVPVEDGLTHEEAEKNWTKGSKVPHKVADAMWGSLVQSFEQRGYGYRK